MVPNNIFLHDDIKNFSIKKVYMSLFVNDSYIGTNEYVY